MTAITTRTPRQLGPYVVGAKIAGGGMATVFVGRAHQPDGGEKVVALKVIKDELVQKDTFVHMFLDEAKILSQLSHPNIIETIECGIEGEHRYIAMELLLGRSVADAWDAVTKEHGRFEPKLAAWICARVANGLHYAHELKGPDGAPLHVIHRDVNPTNIFLTYSGKVKLIDFGLAKSVGRRAKSAQGIVKGKIPYLAPEMIKETEIDRRADIYTLGITLWEMTTGERLFKRKSDVDTLLAIQKAEVPELSEKVPGYPDALAAIVKRALEPDRDKRLPTAAQLAAELDAFVGDVDDDAMRAELTEFLERTFPGEREKQDAWLVDAMHGERAILNATVRPPVPIPTLGQGEEPSDKHTRPPTPMSTPAVIIPPHDSVPRTPTPAPEPSGPSTRSEPSEPPTPRKSSAPDTSRKHGQKSKKKRRHSGRPGEIKSDPPRRQDAILTSPRSDDKRAMKNDAPKAKDNRRDPQSPSDRATTSDLETSRLPPGAGLLLAVLATAILLYALAAR